ncbi:protein LRATD2-like [Saccoglossus kowalevskii]
MGQGFTKAQRLVDKCAPGDLIEFSYPEAKFNHWSVYVGEGAIIHLSRGEIRKELLENACRGRNVRINNSKHDLPARNTDEIVRTAHEQLGLDWYSYQWYGCEQFVVRCRYGVKVNPTDLHKQCEVPRKLAAGSISVVNPLVNYGHQQHDEIEEIEEPDIFAQ